ncbi:hypothetical protein [Streptomyces lydicus]|uniref:hypothetical protein n=1 Tax=Streptomyces lydicus TaxID=47763 RepID=UPI0037AE1E30
MLEAATNAEQAAYDHPGFNDRFDAAGRGVEYSRDMIDQSQNYISSLATLIAATVVLTSLYPCCSPSFSWPPYRRPSPPSAASASPTVRRSPPTRTGA